MPGLPPLRRALAAGAGALCLATLASGCSHTMTERGHLVRLIVTEYRMNPASLRVPPGELTIVVRNMGRLTHNLVISRGDRAQAHTTPMPPGARPQLAVIVTSGRYVLASSLFSDGDLGFYAPLPVSG